MRNIGRAIVVGLALAARLQAAVTAYVDNKQVQAGDSVTFTIESDAENTLFPTISKIGEYPVIASPSSKSIQNINGKVSARLSQSYLFQPAKDVTIPSFVVRANGTSVKTEPVKITVAKRTQTLGERYRFDIAIDKTDPYVGEEVELTATLTIDSMYNLEGLDLFLDRLDGFQVSSSDQNWRGNREGGNIIFKRTFYLYPERSGKIEIPNYPIVGIMSDGRARLFFNESKKFVAYSNSLLLDVKPLPGNATLVGEFALSVKTDKFKTAPGEPVNLTILLAGEGSLDNFPGFYLKIDGVTVYGDKPVVGSERKNGVLNASAAYKFALVSDGNYTIPSFSLTFLNPKTKKVEHIASDEVPIEIVGAQKTAPQVVSSQKAGEEADNKQAGEKNKAGGMPFLAAGIVIGMMLGLLLPKLRELTGRRKEEKPALRRSLRERVRSASSSRELLGYIIHFVGDERFQGTIHRLEEGVTPSELKQIKKELLISIKEKGE